MYRVMYGTHNLRAEIVTRIASLFTVLGGTKVATQREPCQSSNAIE